MVDELCDDNKNFIKVNLVETRHRTSLGHLSVQISNTIAKA